MSLPLTVLLRPFQISAAGQQESPGMQRQVELLTGFPFEMWPKPSKATIAGIRYIASIVTRAEEMKARQDEIGNFCSVLRTYLLSRRQSL